MRNWFSGRAWPLVPITWAIALAIMYAYWYVPSDGPWAPQSSPRPTFVAEWLPIVAGLVALYGIGPLADWIDQQSPKRIRAYDTAAALGLIAAFAVLPVLVRWLWGLGDLYKVFMADHNILKHEGVERLPYADFVGLGVNIAAVLALACLSVAIAGRLIGPITGLIWFAVLLLGQGYGGWKILGTHGRGSSLTWVDAAVLAATILIGLAAYHRSYAGSRPLLG